MHTQFSRAELPESIIDKELAHLNKMGLEIQCKSKLGERPPVSDLAEQFDSVLVAIGSVDPELIEGSGFRNERQEGQNRPRDHAKGKIKNVFIAGTMVHNKDRKVYSIAAGKGVFICMTQFLSGKPIVGT